MDLRFLLLPTICLKYKYIRCGQCGLTVTRNALETLFFTDTHPYLETFRHCLNLWLLRSRRFGEGGRSIAVRCRGQGRRWWNCYWRLLARYGYGMRRVSHRSTPRRFYSFHRLTKVSVDAGVLLSQVTGWDGDLDESDSLQEQVGMDSLQAVEFRRILCVQVRLIRQHNGLREA